MWYVLSHVGSKYFVYLSRVPPSFQMSDDELPPPVVSLDSYMFGMSPDTPVKKKETPRKTPNPPIPSLPKPSKDAVQSSQSSRDTEPTDQPRPPATSGNKLDKTTKEGTTIACYSRFRKRFNHSKLGGEAEADKAASAWIEEQKTSAGCSAPAPSAKAAAEPTAKRTKTTRSPEEIEHTNQIATTFAQGTTARRIGMESWKDSCSRRLKELSAEFPDGKKAYMKICSIEYHRT